MNINEKMELKWEEITTTTNEREALFMNFEVNKDRISGLYFEREIKKLQYMFLKREQLTEMKINSYDQDSISRIEKMNETCISLLTKRLIEDGYEDRLKQYGLVY